MLGPPAKPAPSVIDSEKIGENAKEGSQRSVFFQKKEQIRCNFKMNSDLLQQLIESDVPSLTVRVPHWFTAVISPVIETKEWTCFLGLIMSARHRLSCCSREKKRRNARSNQDCCCCCGQRSAQLCAGKWVDRQTHRRRPLS